MSKHTLSSTKSASQRERINAAYRERIANDPDYRKKRNDKSRRWREKNRGHITEYNAERYAENPEYLYTAVRKSEQKHRQHYLARKAVWYAVSVGKLPPAWSMVCEICGEAQAAHYHHHHGYDIEHRLDVQPVCTECHGKAHWVD